MICARHAPRAAGRCDKSRRAGAGPRAGGDGGAAVVWRHNGGFGAGRGLGAAGLVGRQLAEHEAGEAERAQMLLHPLQQGRVAHHGESPPGEQRGQMARVRRVGTVRGGQGEGDLKGAGRRGRRTGLLVFEGDRGDELLIGFLDRAVD